MISHSIQRLQYLCNNIPGLLAWITEKEFSFKPAPGKWSKKEILGHLIDSAANNHQRFVRTQFENIPIIFYDQNKWSDFSYHNQIGSKQIIAFWAIYNRHLVELLKHIPENAILRKCNIGGPEDVTLEFLINDYVVHMEHHLKQIIDYD